MSSPEYRRGDFRGRNWTLRDRLAALFHAKRQRRFCSYCTGWSAARRTAQEHESHVAIHRKLEHSAWIAARDAMQARKEATGD